MLSAIVPESHRATEPICSDMSPTDRSESPYHVDVLLLSRRDIVESRGDRPGAAVSRLDHMHDKVKGNTS